MKKVPDIIAKVVIAFLLAICIAGIGRMLFEIIFNTANISWP